MSVANFERFRDSSFQLRFGADIDRTLTAFIANTPTTGEGAILMWKHWRQGSGSVTYSVSINGTVVSNPTISDETERNNFVSLHEMINVADIRQGQNNVRFVVTAGSGTLRISDVVILFNQAEIATPGQSIDAAIYETFQDNSFRLSNSGNTSRNLVASLQPTPITGEGAILMWKHWRQGSGSVTYRVSVNGEEISNPTISGGTATQNFVSLHEFINVNDIQQGQNTISFELTDGTGTLRVSDVVILFRHSLSGSEPAVSRRVAGFERFQDPSFALSASGNSNRVLTSSIDSEGEPQTGDGAILMWKHWRKGTGSISYSVNVNGRVISNPTIDADTATEDFVTLHEVIDVGDLDRDETNIGFSITDGPGTLRIGDVVLLYHNRDVSPVT